MASADDVSGGGPAVAAAEACIAADLGAELALPPVPLRLDRLLFAEGGARILVSVPPERAQAWQAALAAEAAAGSPIPAEPLGRVQASPRLSLGQGDQLVVDLAIADLRDSFERAIPRRLGVDLPPSA